MRLPPFDKYRHYRDSVQSPPEDVQFLSGVWRDARPGRGAPLVFREDFCGTFANCCEWVKLGPRHVAHGVDLDPEPLAYGKRVHVPELDREQRTRLHLHKKNVLGPGLPQADLICAMNFSYFIFKDRPKLKRYFTSCRRGLSATGVLILDCFGGSKCTEPNEEESQHGEPPFTYYWDQLSFDPLSNEARFAIHFQRRDERKRLRVFEYDWRMWAPVELKDLLLECGFRRVDFLWEGSTPDGEGDGNFQVAEHGEEAEAWVCYLVAVK
jgi:hypothetical protein